MKNPCTFSLSPRQFLLPLLALVVLTSPLAAASSSTSRYMVVKVTNHEGKIFHKAFSDKAKDVYCKKALQDYLKAKKLYQEEKKKFRKENSSKKFTKLEPKKPTFRTAKRGLKSYRDALKVAYDLDKKLQEKKKKDSKTGKTKTSTKKS